MVDQRDEGGGEEETNDDAHEAETRDTLGYSVRHAEDVVVAVEEGEENWWGFFHVSDCLRSRRFGVFKMLKTGIGTDVDDREVQRDEHDDGFSDGQNKGSG